MHDLEHRLERVRLVYAARPRITPVLPMPLKREVTAFTVVMCVIACAVGVVIGHVCR